MKIKISTICQFCDEKIFVIMPIYNEKGDQFFLSLCQKHFYELANFYDPKEQTELK